MWLVYNLEWSDYNLELFVKETLYDDSGDSGAERRLERRAERSRGEHMNTETPWRWRQKRPAPPPATPPPPLVIPNRLTPLWTVCCIGYVYIRCAIHANGVILSLIILQWVGGRKLCRQNHRATGIETQTYYIMMEWSKNKGTLVSIVVRIGNWNTEMTSIALDSSPK